MNTRWQEGWLHPHIRELARQVDLPNGSSESLDLQASCIALLFGSALLFFLLGFLRYQHALSATLLLASMGALAGALAYLNRAWQRLQQQRLQQALQQLLRRSREKSALHAYLQLLLDAMTVKADKTFLRSLIERANGLLDCALQLEEYQQQLASPTWASLTESRQRLLAKLERSEDPVARRVLEDSLRLLDERLQARQQAAMYLQRVDALQELVMQLFGSLRESLQQWHALAPLPARTDLDSLYERLTTVQQETQAIAQALQELQQQEP